MSPPRVVFHIGLEKTGTTSFQDYCRAHRGELLKASLLYPRNRLCSGAINHAPLAASYFPESVARELLIKPWRADRVAAVAALRREIDASAPGTTLVSAEHFSSRFSPERVRLLAEDFAFADCRIVVVVRDAVARAMSAYSTTIASGRHLSLDDFVDELCRPENPYLRCEETIGRWERAFGRERIRVIAYVEGGDIVGTLLGELAPSHRRGAAPRLNVSPGIAAATALLAVNRDLAAGGRFRRAIGRLRGALVKRTTRPAADRWTPSAEQIGRLEAVAGPDRLWLEQSYGVRFEAPCSRDR